MYLGRIPLREPPGALTCFSGGVRRNEFVHETRPQRPTSQVTLFSLPFERTIVKRFPDNPDLADVQAEFAGDRYAYVSTGCRVVEAWKGHAICEMEITENHRNAMHNVMGGAIYTLADYALAIACNIGEEPTVSVSSTIEYLKATKGTRLIADANVDRSGRTMGFYTIDVTDDLGVKIARMVSTCVRP